MAGLAPMCFFNNTMNEVRNVVYLIHLILMYGLEWCFTYVYIYILLQVSIYFLGGRGSLDTRSYRYSPRYMYIYVHSLYHSISYLPIFNKLAYLAAN